MERLYKFWRGPLLRDVYPHARWYHWALWNVTKFLRKTCVVASGVALLLIAGYAGREFWPNTVYAVKNNEIVNDSLSKKIEQLKWDVVDRLQACESAGHTEEYGLVTFDPDSTGKSANIPSYGPLQFKKQTVIEYSKSLNGKDLSGKQAIELALDADRARDLAYHIIFDVQGGIWNWKNCADKLKLGDDIGVIRKLEN